MLKRTKIVATVGPASGAQQQLLALIEAGVDVFRINFSHGDEEQRGEFLTNIRKAEHEGGRPVAICGDLCGPKIRVGMIQDGEVNLANDREIVIQRARVEGTADRISTTLAELVDVVRVGETILLADGRLRFEVVRISPPEEFTCHVVVGGPLSSGKGVNLPDTELPISSLTEKDRRDIHWIAERDFDYVALSFVQRAEDVNELRSLLRQHGSDAQIITKIEKPRALDHIDTIIDSDGLVSCGDESTQLTWMDAKCGDVVFTPRHGKPVELNALWYHALCALAKRAEVDDAPCAARYRELASQAGNSFGPTFWNEEGQYLYDLERDGWKDPAVRPNQIFAASLPHSPLSKVQQGHVLTCVENQLLTPYGLRSLSPQDPAYRGRYEGGVFDRDSVYHQGTVWSWLTGAYAEAYLRVHEFSNKACAEMRGRLRPLIDQLDSAGLGSVSEIFDGDAPHAPRGCIAQAWSVAELLRAWRMVSAERP